MAISTHAIQSEMSYLRERASRAGSRDEFEYYNRKLRDLEMRYDIESRLYSYEQSHMMPKVVPSQAPDPVTPLTFLKTADKKLLLTGATQ